MYRYAHIFSLTLRISILLSFLLGSFALPRKAYAASITVNTNADSTNVNGLCSLREAIDNANNDALTHTDCVMGSGNDTIQFNSSLGAATITLVSTLPTISDPDGLTINGGGDITIHGNNLFRIFVVGNSVLTLDSITLTNGKCPSCNGGAAYVSGGTLTIANSTFSNNDGSAIYSYNGVLTVTNSNFSNNSATYGGAIQISSTSGNESTTSITNSTFSNNSAPSGGGGSSIYSHGVTTITGSTFSNDTSGAGSIYNNAGLSITSSTFSGNTATNNGGAIFNYNPGFLLAIEGSAFSANGAPGGAGGVLFHGAGSATITNSTFSDNLATAGIGGGIYTYNSAALVITNSTFSANSAGAGGAIYSHNNSVFTVKNSTFSGNGATTGGAIYHQDTPSFILQNSILANSTGGSDCYNVNGDTINISTNNFIETNGPSGHMCGTPSITGVDPALGPLTDNGGSGQTFALLTGSLAIDAGDDAVCAAAPVNNTSQNGVMRPQGTHCDIGAFESVPPALTVKSVNTNDGWILESTETSGAGGTMNSAATTFNLGDASANRQYRGILHFDTSALPDTAVVTQATLRIRKQGIVGTNPFNILGLLKVDMRKPAFGAATLALADFSATTPKTNVATFGAPAGSWYSALLNNAGRVYLNRTGTTQFRIYFTTDDNNDNGDDYMKFFSGNAAAGQQPQLIIEYYVP